MSHLTPSGQPRPWGRPHPRLDQIQRTWYFFRRNSLGLVGLGIVLSITGIAAYSAALPIPWTQVPIWCATDYGPAGLHSGYPGNYTQVCPTTGPIICTYEVTPPPNAAHFCDGLWYKDIVRSGISFPSIIAPTLSVSPPIAGPMPLGALSVSSGSRTPVYNLAGMLARGSDWTLMYSLSIVGAGALVGLLVGSAAGFYGGRVDEISMRIVDIFLSIPTILFVIVVVAVLAAVLPSSAGGDLLVKSLALVGGFTVVWWPFYARIVRSQVLTVREQKFIEAARASGAPQRRILFRHIIPNSVYPVFIQFSLDVGTIPLLIGTLVYLGFSNLIFPSTPFPEWGAISATSVLDLQGDFLNSCYTPGIGCVIPWWQLLFPGLALFFFAISVNLISDALRDALDPRMRR
ncbi:MAG TPA: ABC transporter permease [Thermoplasmata archaeon]|nr:ABC transporter permease [Thermoplasmata archaeon]